MGFIILLSDALFLFLLAFWVRKRFSPALIQSYLYAGGNVRLPIIAISIFNTWLWTTSILGATEAGITYGLLGCFIYPLGADAGLVLVIVILQAIRKKNRDHIFLTDLIKGEFSPASEAFFYGICILMAAYTVIQQAVGIANVFTMIWGISYKFIAFLTVFCAAVFVIHSGMRGVLIHDLLGFMIIMAGLAAIVAIIVLGDSSQAFSSGFALSVEDLQDNLQASAVLPFFKGLLFFILSFVTLGASQTILDPNYYIKAKMIREPKMVKHVFLTGGVYMWAPVVIVTSIVLSSLWRTYMGRQGLESLNTNLLTGVLFARSPSLGLKTAFTATMIVIAITTMANAFVGVLALMTIRGHDLITGETGNDSDKIRFGRLFTMMFAIFCALIALSLENISLFVIDIICGIFFAAPCGIVLFHKQIRVKSGYLPIMVAVAGITAGIAVWAHLKNQQYNIMLGAVVSFLTPVVLIPLFRLLRKD